MLMQSLSLALATSLLVARSQAARPALLRIQPIKTVQKQSHADFDMVTADAERSLREMLEYHPEIRKLGVGYSLPLDILSLSFPIDLSLSYQMTPPPRIDGDESSDGGSDDSSDTDASTGNDTSNDGRSSDGGAGQGDTTTNNESINGLFSTIRSEGADNEGLKLGKTGKTGLTLFMVVGGLVVMALIVDQKRRAAAATAAASIGGGGASSSLVAGAYYDDNSTISGESIAAGGGGAPGLV